MLEELGVSSGTAFVILIALYFIIKWAVKNGVKEAYEDIRGEEIYNKKKRDEKLNHIIELKIDTDNNN